MCNGTLAAIPLPAYSDSLTASRQAMRILESSFHGLRLRLLSLLPIGQRQNVSRTKTRTMVCHFDA
jgi:hypothetical protein